jgi:hypothetical protein
MMKRDDLENELRNLKFTHLTETELAAYIDQQPDPLDHVRMEAHLKQCFICERHLALLQEERAALSNRQVTADEVTFVEQLMEQMGLTQEPPLDPPVTNPAPVSLQERLVDYLSQMMASWRIAFMRGAMRGMANEGEVLWQWQSADGKLQARAVMETNADLTLHFSSNEMELEGTRYGVRLGLFSQEMTLQRVSESKVAAKIAVPWQHRRGNMTELFIEAL